LQQKSTNILCSDGVSSHATCNTKKVAVSQSEAATLLCSLFEFDVEFTRKLYLEGVEAEKNGEQVCWSEDIALLVNHGII
jgi:hypothetical protein